MLTKSASRAAAAAAIALSALGTSAVFSATSSAAKAPPAVEAGPLTPDDFTTDGPDVAVDGTVNDANNDCLLYTRSKGRNADDELIVRYRLACRNPINAFQITINHDVTYFDAEPIIYARGTANWVVGDSFTCTGDTPGNGINCVGSYAGRGNYIRGEFTLDVPGKSLRRQFPKTVITASTVRWNPVMLPTGKPSLNPAGIPLVSAAVAGPFKQIVLDKKGKTRKTYSVKKWLRAKYAE